MSKNDLAEEHAVELSLLWELRDHAVDEPHYTLQDLFDLDERIAAHADALLLHGVQGRRACAESLAEGEAPEIFAGALTAARSDDPGLTTDVIERSMQVEGGPRALTGALAWCGPLCGMDIRRQLLTAAAAELRTIGIASSAACGIDPGEPLRTALRDDDDALRARAFRAIGELALGGLASEVLSALGRETDESTFWAAWSAARLGWGQGLPILRDRIGAEEPRAERALKMVLRSSDPKDSYALQRELARSPGEDRLAVIAAGILGDPALILWLVERMAVPELARVAGEAFSMITGCDLAFEDLDAEPPDDLDLGPTEDPDDPDTALDPDEELPWPDAELVAAWWSQSKSVLAPGRRYLTGRPLERTALIEVLRAGYQRQRGAAALQLAILGPDQPLFRVRAQAASQRTELG